VETITRSREAPIVSSASHSGVQSLGWPRWATWETIPATVPGAVESPRFLVIVSSRRAGSALLARSGELLDALV